MTTKILWHDRFNIGVESVDKAHQRLFSIVNKMLNYDQEDEKGRQWVCGEGIKYFKSYTLKHFADEEAYMKSINYSGYAAHKRVHDDLKEKTLPALERDMIESDYSVESVQHFLGICIGWLTGHIMLEDHAITGRISNKWKYERTEELSVLEEAAARVIKELLGVEAQVI
ncbi:MAG: bacteriohemerythrin, partial [Lachnospiraceae bacterium]|nr:bacteriohemerythrin [Lachnospiraceae bacterium]